MREIKFRAWDKWHKRMWISGQEGESTEDGWTFQTWFNPASHELHAIIFIGRGKAIEERQLPIMEYTGLIDKTEKEIYEKDFYKRKTTANEDIHGTWALYEVIYRNGLWISSYVVSEKGQVMPRGYMASAFVTFDNIGGWDKDIILEDGRNQMFEVEIIGNIYDNPEFLPKP